MELTSILSLAFGFGLLHALDADHVLAVSGLSGIRREHLHSSLSFSLRWALGHGSSVMIIGAMVLFAGMAIPEQFSQIVENLIAFLLLGIGLLLLFDWQRQRNTLYCHQHDSMPVHVHMHRGKPLNPLHRHRHGTTLVGLLHGVAGSAPLLVLLPLSKIGSPALGMAYLLVFSIGVLISMLVFGGLLGRLFSSMQGINRQAIEHLRLLLAIITIGFAVYLMTGV
jgi:sulfite exporter TauE/SafE